MVALRDARRLSWLLTTTAGAAVRDRMARRGGDGKTPSSPAETTALGTPSAFPTPKALFPAGDQAPAEEEEEPGWVPRMGADGKRECKMQHKHKHKNGCRRGRSINIDGEIASAPYLRLF